MAGILVPNPMPLTIRPNQFDALGKALPADRNIYPCPSTKTWIEIRLRDCQGNPAGGAAYLLELPDRKILSGNLGASGEARLENLIAGTCQVSFPEYDDEAWMPIPAQAAAPGSA